MLGEDLKKKRKRERQIKRRRKLTEEQKNQERKAAKGRMRKNRETMNTEKIERSRANDRTRRQLARKCKMFANKKFSDASGTDIDQHNFDCHMASLGWFVCKHCGIKTISLPFVKQTCQNCAAFALDSDIDPRDVPPELSELTMVEQLLIARIHPVVSVFKIRNSQYKYSGNVINFPQNVQEVASVLPYKVEDVSGLITIRQKGSDGFRDFQVRERKVKEALVWLRSNNPFYADIEISEDNCELLPIDGNIYSSTRGYNVLENDSEEFELCGKHECDLDDMVNDDLEEDLGDYIAYKDVPNLSMTSQRDKVDNSLVGGVLLWPSIGKKAINEFSSPGYISMAFPSLFPYGKGDYSAYSSKDISLPKYIQYLMLYKDGRFAKDPRFRFFLLNSYMRWQSLTVGNVFVQKTNFFSQMTVIQLKNYLEKHPDIIGQIMFYSSRLRSTKCYWRSRTSELTDMVEQLGAPTIFFTLSAADFHWKDLYRLLGFDDSSSLTSSQKAKLINDNPLIVSTFFKHRVEYFLNVTFKNHFDVEDIWYRVEFQHRGSCHVHGVAWLRGAPNVKDLDTEDKKEFAKSYFDKLISCINPDIQVTPSLVHPCAKNVSDIVDHEEDLCQLVNRVQRHTKCSTQYCLKQKKGEGLKCRFGFPKDLLEETELISVNGSTDINFARNDSLLNKYNPWLLRTWRSNVDVSPILSERIIYQYIAKYASKCEIKSNVYDNLLESVLNQNIADNEHCKKIIRKILIKSCSERDYSAQEVMYLLLGYKLFHSSRCFVVLNLKSLNWSDIGNSQRNTIRKQTFFDHYASRPDCMESISIKDLAKSHYFGKGKWIKRKKEAVVRCFPRKKSGLTVEFDDLRNECIFNLPWRNVQEFARPIDELRELLIAESTLDSDDNMIFECSDVEESDVDDDDEGEGVAKLPDNRDNWEALSGFLKSNDSDENVIGKRTVDKNYDWDQDCEKYDLDLLHQLSCDVKTLTKQTCKSDVDESLLQSDQIEVLNFFKTQVKQLKKKLAVRKRLCIVQGKAGYGKTYLLKCMVKYCKERLGVNSCAVIAPTGVAARNVDGQTIHSFCRFTKNVQQIGDLGIDELQKLQEQMKDLKVLFVDEYSMVGCRLLALLKKRCQEGKDCTELFGNLVVYLMGDIYQITPVGDKPLFCLSGVASRTPYIDRGKLIIGSFNQAFVLNVPKRFSDNDFISFLDRLSVGICNEHDLKRLKERFVSCVSSSERSTFVNAVQICSTNPTVNEFNNLRMSENGEPIAKLTAQNNCRAAFGCSDVFASGLANTLYLSKGCKVMLRSNVNVNFGLVNGSIGFVQDIIYEKGCGPPQLPSFVTVKFPNVEGFEALAAAIPFRPSTTSWSFNRKRCTRVQYPFTLSYACTVHKSQGLTLSNCIIDLGNVEFQMGLTYVAFSRVKKFENLLLNKSVNLDRLNCVKRCSQFVERENFIAWLNSLK